MSLFIGIAASAIGFTAWPLVVPVLFILCGLDLYLTLFSSLLVDCANALVMTIIAKKNNCLDVRQGIRLAVFAVVWIVAGFSLGRFFIPGNDHLFRGSAGVITLFIGILFIVKGIRSKPGYPVSTGSPVAITSKNRPTNGTAFQKKGIRPHFVYAGVGVMAFQIGFLGIGGGMGYAISLMLFLSYPVLTATGTAMLMTLCSTLVGAGLMFFQIPADALSGWQWFIPMMVILSMTGTLCGAKITYALPTRQIHFLIGGVVILAGALAMCQKYFVQIMTAS